MPNPIQRDPPRALVLALVTLAFLLAPGRALAESPPDPARTGEGWEFSATLFKPGIAIDDSVRFPAGTLHAFTSRRNDYTGLYLGFRGPGTIALRGGFGIGREDLRLYLEGPGGSLEPISAASNWFYSDAGAGLNLRAGPLDFTPSIGVGLAFTNLHTTGPDLDDIASKVVVTLNYELPVRLRVAGPVGLSAAWHGFGLLAAPMYDFSGVQMHSSCKGSHEIRAGLYFFR